MKDVFVVISKEQLESMKDRLDALMEKVRRLEELDPRDRETRYKKAIEQLMDSVRSLAVDVLLQETYGGFYAPINNSSFTFCLEEYLLSDEFKEANYSALNAAEQGDVVGFYAVCSDIRAVISEIVEAFGGREDWT